MKGRTPLKIVVKLTSLTAVLMTKTFMPTGGWIRPSSTVMTMMIPNQTGSKPIAVTTGKDDRNGQDDHRHGVHEAPQREIHQHDQREHAVAAKSEAGEEFRHLLRRLSDREEITEQQRADENCEHRRGGARRLQKRLKHARGREPAPRDADEEAPHAPTPPASVGVNRPP